jgi:hypothetical protein
VARSWYSIKRGLAAGVIALCACAFSADGAEYKAWTGDFMRMGAGARTLAMGNAYTALEGDIYSSYFNPAGLAVMDNREFSFSYRYLSMDRKFRYIAYGSPVGPDAGFAITWLNAGTESIEGRDLNGRSTGLLKDDRNSFTVSFAKELNRWVSLGLNTKLAFWKLGGEDARAFGFDLGIIARPLSGLTTALVVRDINSRFTWKSGRWGEVISGSDGQSLEKEDAFPAFYTIGAAYHLLDDDLVFSGTVEIVEDNPPGLDLGAAYTWRDRFTFRTGIANYTGDDELDQGSYAAGFTVAVSQRLSVDYTFATDSVDDDSIHIFALHMSYGE